MLNAANHVTSTNRCSKHAGLVLIGVTAHTVQLKHICGYRKKTMPPSGAAEQRPGVDGKAGCRGDLRNGGEKVKKHLRFVSLDLAVLDGGVIQVRVQLDSLVRSSAVLVLHSAVTVRARL